MAECIFQAHELWAWAPLGGSSAAASGQRREQQPDDDATWTVGTTYAATAQLGEGSYRAK